MLLELLLPLDATKILDGLWLGAEEGNADGIWLGDVEGNTGCFDDGIWLGAAEGNTVCADVGIWLGAPEGKNVKVDVMSVIAPKSMLASSSLAIKACSMAF